MKPIYNFKIHGPIRNFEMAPQLGCHYLIETSVTAADADGSISTKAIYKKTVPIIGRQSEALQEAEMIATDDMRRLSMNAAMDARRGQARD